MKIWHYKSKLQIVFLILKNAVKTRYDKPTTHIIVQILTVCKNITISLFNLGINEKNYLLILKYKNLELITNRYNILYFEKCGSFKLTS